ncbi:MAG: HAD family hydrolase [Gammaproteobacteria bacterium]|nr:HAD family hydrolase [Gammaproteobacteria bacterium]
MKQLKAIIFDVDGTLSETERDGHRVAFNRAFSEAGLDWVWDEELYGKLLAVTGGKERIRFFLSDFHQDFSYDGDIEQLVVQLHAEKTKHYVTLLETKAIGLRPGVARLITEIRDAGLRLAIATTTTPANVTALITSTLGEQALSWFDCIAAGDVVPAKKPAPDIFDYCLEQLGLNPEQCLVFEDSANGVLASRGANLPTVVTFNNYTADDDFSGAISVFNHLGEADMPCQLISGVAIEHDYVTVADLHRLHVNG